MEGWVLAGVILGFVLGILTGVGVSFGYISYRSYRNYIKLQSDIFEAQNSHIVSSGGMSA